MNIFSQPRLAPCGGSAKASHNGDCRGGLEGLVRQLHPLGGDHKALVVGGDANLDFNIAEV